MTPSSRQRLIALAALALGLAGAVPACQNVPSHRKIMRYHRYEELEAARQITDLRAQLDSGEISEANYDAQARKILDNAPGKAMDSLFRDHLLDTRSSEG